MKTEVHNFKMYICEIKVKDIKDIPALCALCRNKRVLFWDGRELDEWIVGILTCQGRRKTKIAWQWKMEKKIK